MATDEEIARKLFELENKVVEEDVDSIFLYNEGDHQQLTSDQPYKEDHYYFKKIKISAVALIKMVMHARSGGNIEVMGYIQGKVEGDTFFVFDTFILPVEASETRVVALEDSYSYITKYLEMASAVGRNEAAIGWYHSHPGYGCWLSGIDIATQRLQQAAGPFVAIVIDPKRTITAGKVDIGAFRAFPANYIPPNAEESEYQHIPLSKIEDFGTNYKQYYSLEVSFFKSSTDTHLLDLLWNKYWITSLSSSIALQNKSYTAGKVDDISKKISSLNSKGQINRTTFQKVTRDSASTAREEAYGTLTQMTKSLLFKRCGSDFQEMID